LKVTQLEIMPIPPKVEDKMLNWPNWPVKLRTSSSHEEGAERDFAVMTKRFEGENGAVSALECVRLDEKLKPIEGTEFSLKADLVLLEMGFISPVKEGMLADLGVALDNRGNVLADTKKYASSVGKVFACGDMRRGQSLVVWAIREGRQCAAAIDEALIGETALPR
jgi:glutamate synthase (NADPH/NADH) small chain